MSRGPVPASPLGLNVSFTFKDAWEAGPTGVLTTFPPGGGGSLGIHEVVIAPVDLAGKTAAEIVEIQARRAHDIALVAQAIAVAEAQFVDALAKTKSE